MHDDPPFTSTPRVRDGVYAFTDDEYAESFGEQWTTFARTQLDSASGLDISEQRFRDVTGWSPQMLSGATVLDAGCGAGRFAEVAAKWGARVTGADLSSAVYSARKNVALTDDIRFVQADCFSLPFAPRSFDFAYSIGVAQHTPDPLGFVRAVASMVRPGGAAAFWVYERSIRSWLHPKPWLRLVTKHLSFGSNLRVARALVKASMPVAEAAQVLPTRVRRVVQRALPAATHFDFERMDARTRREWAIVDTVDWISPRYDTPQTWTAVVEALHRGGSQSVERRPVPGICAVARF